MIICLTVSLFIISFNRYMVECECTCQILIYSDMRIVLIDTWWNVNDKDFISVCKISKF